MTNVDHNAMEALEDQLTIALKMLFRQPTGESRNDAIVMLSRAKIAVQHHRERG